MPCLEHEKPARAIKRGPTKVLLKVKPPDGNLDGVDVYLWVKSTCDCGTARSCPRFRYEVDLKKEKAFLSENVCRDQDGKRQLLYCATVQRRHLGTPAPLSG